LPHSPETPVPGQQRRRADLAPVDPTELVAAVTGRATADAAAAGAPEPVEAAPEA